jgi:hypothetical protein
MRQEAAVAAVAALDIYEEEEESSIAAIRGRQSQPQHQPHQQRREKKRDPKKAAAAMAEMEPELSRSACLASGLCISHWRFGAKAHSCIRPCTWAGNGLAGGN